MRPHRLLAAALAALALPTAAFAVDSRNPGVIRDSLVANGATAELKSDNGAPYIEGKTNGLNYSVNFYRCNDAKTACDAVVYEVGWNDVKATQDQINRWNRWTIYCPAFLAKDSNNPHAWYGTKGFADDSNAYLAAQQTEWFKCVNDFAKFTDDPEAFLAAHN